MSRWKKKPASRQSASASRKPKRNKSTGDEPKGWFDQFLEAWQKKAERERSTWSSRPRLHTAIFEDALRDNELEKHFASNNIAPENAELFARQKDKRRHEIDRRTANLGWSPEQLKLFMEQAVTYRKCPSIENYLRVRHEFPEVEIQVGQFAGMDPLFSLEADLKKQGVDPNLVAGAHDADEPSIDALCLHLLELLAARNQLPKGGPGYIEEHRSAISEATVNYLISMMLEAFDCHDDTFRVPASLVVLIRHQLCGQAPDLEMMVRLRERQARAAKAAAERLKPGERLSINKLKEWAGIPRTTAERWINDPHFQSSLDSKRKLAGRFEEAKRAAIQRLMS